MAARLPTGRNLWIIAALVAFTAGLLAFILGSGAGIPGTEIAEVSVEAPPGADGSEARPATVSDAVAEVLPSQQDMGG